MAFLLEITSTEMSRQIQRLHLPFVRRRGVVQAGCFQTEARVNSSEAIIFTRLTNSPNMCSATTRRFLGTTGVRSCKHPPRQMQHWVSSWKENMSSMELLRPVPSLCISLGGEFPARDVCLCDQQAWWQGKAEYGHGMMQVTASSC